MTWIIGITGFIAGFAVGIIFLKYWLRDISREELINDKTLHWRYGVFVWLFSVACAALSVTAYHQFF